MELGTTQEVFSVCQTFDSVIIQIKGKANYQNASLLSKFLEKTLYHNFKKYCISFYECIEIDSTCLGILAGLLLKLQKINGVCLFCGLKERQLESIRLLGLDQFAQIVNDIEINNNDVKKCFLECENSIFNPNLILEAHKFLMELNARNKIRFQDVVHFLEKDINT